MYLIIGGVILLTGLMGWIVIELIRAEENDDDGLGMGGAA